MSPSQAATTPLLKIELGFNINKSHQLIADQLDQLPEGDARMLRVKVEGQLGDYFSVLLILT